LLTIEMLPFAAPAVVGANFTLNEVVWPATNVSGVESPEVLNAAPDTFAEEIVALAEPEFVNVTV
jgi:hypothetical protein